MFCTKCGSMLQDGVRFCTACGAQVSCGDFANAATQVDLTTLPESYGAPAASASAYGASTPAYGASTSAYGAPAPSHEAHPASGGGMLGASVSLDDLVKRKGLVAAVAAACVVVAIAVGVFALPAVLGDGVREGDGVKAEQSDGKSSSQGHSGAKDQAGGEDADGIAADSDSENTADDSQVADQQNGQYILSDSNARYYTESELNAMSLEELFYARNEIFARHGRGFNNPDLASYFNAQPWYTQRYSPETFDSMASPLNDYEKKNSELMLEVEKRRNSPYLS